MRQTGAENALRWRMAKCRPVPMLITIIVAAAGALTVVPLPARAADAPGTWHTTGELAVSRSGHSETLLTDGRVLLAGGGTPTSEIYDPATGQSALTGQMSVARRAHTATLLPDGQVLVVGGRTGNSTTPLSSAELFNPLTGQWASAGTVPGGGRVGHTTTVLPGGRVLVAGGFKTVAAECMDTLDVCESGSSTAIYDPTAPVRWVEGTPMSSVRGRHTATVLKDGRVLVAGGGGAPVPGAGNYDDATTGTSADLYDSYTDLWIPTAPLAFNRWGHTATLLPNGNVIVAGGLNCGTSPPRLPVGGANINLCGTTSSSEVYDSATGVWSPASSLTSARISHTADLLGGPACDSVSAAPPSWCGKILVAGGYGAEPSSEIFDPAVEGRDDAGRPVQGAWMPTGSLVEPRYLHTSTYLGNGRVVAAGGNGTSRGIEVFEPTPSTRRPSVVALEPATGPTSGKSRVVITGAGFSNVTSVRFGEREAIFYRVDSATTITAASPPTDRPETVHVTVTVASAETSLRTAADRFTYHASNGTWSATAAMAAPRSHHTATMLKGGQVLVAGGVRAGRLGTPLRSSEAYNPLSEQWRAVAEMNEARAQHTATALPDGKVLVTGGFATRSGDTGPPLSSSELYDPSTGTWERMAPMNQERIGHTATLLDDGSVLVVGGGPSTSEIYKSGTWTTLRELQASHPRHTATLLAGHKEVLVVGADTSEIYDTSNHIWRTRINLNSPRDRHTATLLPSGQVLIAGGADAAPLDTSEVYDPVASSWSQSGKLGEARADHTATNLGGGRILVAGGRTARAEIYDAATGRWSPALSLLTPRSAHTAILLPGGDKGDRVLVAGGIGSEVTRLASAEVFDPTTSHARLSVLSITPPIGTTSGGSSVIIIGSGFFHPETRVQFGAVPAVQTTIASDREIIAITPPHSPGEVDVKVTTPGATALARYDYASGVWSAAAPLTPCMQSSPSCVPRYNHTTTVLANGKVLVTGGLGGTNDQFVQFGKRTAAQLYDPVTAAWFPAASMVAARSAHTATLLSDGSVLVVGRPNPGQIYGNEAPETYQPLADKWAATGPIPVSPTFGHTSTLLPDGRVLVAGGNTASDATGATALYDHITRRWSAGDVLSTSRRNHTATLLDDGRVLVAGGEVGTLHSRPTWRASTEIYNPATAEWGTAEGALGLSRSFHTATLLDDGRVLVAGGEGVEGSLSSAEIFDPSRGVWASAAPLLEARSGHSATKLPGGKVLVTGGLINGTELQSSEVYDPSTDSWSHAGLTTMPRADHAAVVLAGRGCGVACGRVLLTGGREPATAASELFTPGPEIIRLSLEQGPSGGGTPVVITGRALDGATAVRLGDVPVDRFTVDSPTQITAVTPPHRAGTVEVVVTTPGGSSLANPPRPNEFTFVSSGVPGRITDLAAKVLSEAGVELSWTTAGSDGVFGPPATRYLVKESTSPISNEDEFDAATTVCEGGCSFPAASLGRPISLLVDGLTPGTGYHYAVRAVGPNGSEGPTSNTVSVTTPGAAPVLDANCPVLPAPEAGQLIYRSGYSMVGLPAGTRVDAQSPLYSWFDIGARGSYSTQPGNEPVAEGRGYWAWFSCPRLVNPAGEGVDAVDLPLGGYRASMVGNPSGTKAAALSGHDFAARWDPALNDGAGGYRISGHRDEQTLPVGGATWVFSYRDTTISLRSR